VAQATDYEKGRRMDTTDRYRRHAIPAVLFSVASIVCSATALYLALT